ncbi:MAG: recombination protein RecR [Gammaproteobacteria bacterium]|nr:recombination protein RecR [Gammaproteobacteria bacterium]
MTTPLLTDLIKALQCLPGIGPKSAQRAAFHLLERNRDGARRLSRALEQAMSQIGRCEACRTFSETPRCRICDSPERDGSVLCVVETPLDVTAIEHALDFKGQYFVLMGRLSPIDGVSPATLKLEVLEARLAQGVVKELIVATGTTMEGEATAHYLKQMALHAKVAATRIAYGIPVGGDLEYVDSSTLSLAIQSRRAY